LLLRYCNDAAYAAQMAFEVVASRYGHVGLEFRGENGLASLAIRVHFGASVCAYVSVV
jgi:hypothetical protein